MMNGYVHLPGTPSTRQPGKFHGLIVMIDKTNPGCAPGVVGRMVLRGFIAPAQSTLGEAPNAAPIAPSASGLPEGAHLRPIGRLSPLSESQEGQPSLRAVQSGQAYRITSSADRNLVSPALAEKLETIFDQFAMSRGFSPQAPLAIVFARGYDQGDRGHGSGLAMDIASVGGRSLHEWKQDWDHALARSRELPDREARRAAMTAETQRNLGYQLYRTLIDRGGWRVFNNVVQLFGPWTDRLGPWRRLHFETPTDAQRQMMAEQERIFQAHQDHIHVAMG